MEWEPLIVNGGRRYGGQMVSNMREYRRRYGLHLFVRRAC